MNNSDQRPFDREDFQSTIPSAPTDPEAKPHRPRCRFAKGSGSASGLTDELACLLRSRLRVAILILLCGFVFYFVRQLLGPSPVVEEVPFTTLFDGCIIAIMTLVSAILWGPLPLSMKKLRAIELMVFGIIGVFFGWMQFHSSRNSALLQAVGEVAEGQVFRVLTKAHALPWVILIVVYGTIIPNTWRRCAAVVGVMAFVSIALSAIGVFDPSAGQRVAATLPDNILLMGIASAVAIFGSYRIRQLQEKAHEAQKVGQYRLKKKLGTGGMGEVYLAEHVMLRRPCAVKLIRADQAGNPKTLRRFEREVQATAKLTHWNTIEIFDYGHAEDGTFYYVMEYLPGMNLEDLVGRYGPMPPERAVHLLRQVCLALREAHGVGLIHRDIKPSNIFACERGRVYDVAKLLDFGLVKNSGLDSDDVKLTLEGSMTGSPAYMSPEQAAGRRQLDARSDIYNLGAVAYFLITGQLLFERESPLQMLHAHAYEPIVPGAEFQMEVPADLQQVILRCLEKDPSHRYGDAESLERALAACECAGAWTAERAEQWWRQQGTGLASAVTFEAVQRDGPTVFVNS
jgi:serine/threonine-protein kinase